MPFSPLLIGEVHATWRRPRRRRRNSDFQSPPHRGSSRNCGTVHARYRVRAAFQSPPHRGSSRNSTTDGLQLQIDCFQSPPHRGSSRNHDRPNANKARRTTLSVPSSSGKFTQRGAQEVLLSLDESFSPLLIGEVHATVR